MCFAGFFLERPCRLAVPIDRAKRLEDFRCILLHRHQVVSVVAFDDTAGGISDCVQRVYRDNMSVKRHFFEKRPDGSLLAILVIITVTGNGQPCVMRNQSCGFEMVVPVAVRAPEALAIDGNHSALKVSFSMAHLRRPARMISVTVSRSSGRSVTHENRFISPFLFVSLYFSIALFLKCRDRPLCH